ncbi:hypothetical protein BC938DRAFT_472726 [Jimgerdemannia flammicorona]|uniref:Ubiquitinyl hydrolase 1 n=1 Tax=Jimgerdemannia flammicorona TaxID=994334 RepID=A0A433Q5H2_9FUNG|nr:hypothetical protein BC938DRAFT_472726 [Jimgerdemannia flammicorona]
MEPTKKFTPGYLTGASNEILFEIAKKLLAEDVLNFSYTNRLLHTVCSQDWVWKHLCFRDHGVNFIGPDTSWKRFYYSEDIKKVCRHLSAIDEKESLQSLQQYYSVALKCSIDECNTQKLWMCLAKGCSVVACGRSGDQNGHAEQHYEMDKEHGLVIQIRTLQIWCYTCDKWIGTPNSHPAEKAKVNAITRLICNTMNRPDLQSEVALNSRRQHERDLEEEITNDGKCVLISMIWMKEWCSFMTGNPLPGPVDNRSLLLANGSVNPDMSIPEDFVIISMNTWAYLEQYYGVDGRMLSEGALQILRYRCCVA